MIKTYIFAAMIVDFFFSSGDGKAGEWWQDTFIKEGSGELAREICTARISGISA